MAKNYTTKIKTLPMIPMRGITIYPSMVVHFDVGRQQSLGALEEAVEKKKEIFFICQKNLNQLEDFTIDDLYPIGTVCSIKQILKLPGNNIRVLAEGIGRGRIKEIIPAENFHEAKISQIIEKNLEITEDIQGLMRSIMTAFEEYASLEAKVSPELLTILNTITNPVEFCDMISANLVLKPEQYQEILETLDIEKRLLKLHDMIYEENKILQIEKRLRQRVRLEMSRNEKEHYLHQQMKAINKELGNDDISMDVENYKEKLESLDVSDEIKEKIQKEIKKLSRSSRNSSDAEVSRNYLETFFSLPWNKSTKDNIDLKNSRKILDKEHYGLEKVKERIIEYLAVKKLSNSMKGPIICLVGPPGVGKTSIAKSIAKSIGRNFQRISLGGTRDEAEILGHRRTYIGAIPGRIINALIQAKSTNPVILFDEIDKMSGNFKGDPASALLEVLDPEQNKNFTDHYMELPFDLSSVMFIATANSLSDIPRPLLDRMEVIELSGYTDMEKLEIAKRYLIPKQLKEHALKEKFISITDEVLLLIISKWTRESGVRNLERQIGKICRKGAKRKVDNPKLNYIKITENTVEKYLGKRIYDFDMMNDKPMVGIVRGLAWTAVGGVTLSIEVNTMAGSGKLSLTGQLGDVMKESAQTALSYIRSISDKYPIEEEFYKNIDIHMHIPEGATPKDGPSAGITMAVAMLSALTDMPVRNDIAMTGEITLRGRVLPIGGVKEKLLAAYRAGINNVILPKENEKDLVDIPEEVRKKLNITLAEDMDIVLEKALLRKEKRKK